MFSVITNIYNKKTKRPTLMELFAATEKLKNFFFWQLEMFDVCTTGDMAQKLSRRLWSSSDNCCTIWMRYGLNTKHLRRNLHTVVFNINSSLAVVPVYFFGLCRKLARTRSSSLAVNGRPLDFCLHRHPISVNCLYHARFVLSVGGSFAYFARNARCTVTTDLLVWYSIAQNDFSPWRVHFLTTNTRIA